MRRSAAPFLAVLIVVALVGLLVYGVASKGEDRSLDDAVAEGRAVDAPDRSLPLLGATGERSLASLRGKVVVLNFWASWCDPCKDEAPALERAHRTLSRAGTGTVLGVTFRDASRDSQAFVKEFGLTYPSVRDVDGDLAEDYGVRALPETFVIDGDGHIAGVSRGVVDEAWLKQTLDKAGA